MHKIKTAARPQKFCRRAYHIFKCTEDLMACRRLFDIRVYQPMLPDHIRRIRCDDIKRSRSKHLSGFLYISADDIQAL